MLILSSPLNAAYDPTSPLVPPSRSEAPPTTTYANPPRTSSLPSPTLNAPPHQPPPIQILSPSHQSHITNNTYFPPSPTNGGTPSTPTVNEHALAAQAAQREVEREMDSLAYTSASPSTNPESYAPSLDNATSPTAGGRKMNAGAFFKRPGGRQFTPPPSGAGEGDRGRSASEDEAELEQQAGGGGGTQPLNVLRRSREAAPPYVG